MYLLPNNPNDWKENIEYCKISLNSNNILVIFTIMKWPDYLCIIITSYTLQIGYLIEKEIEFSRAVIIFKWYSTLSHQSF